MADELRSMRMDFVRRVSKPVISDLLDRISEEFIISDEEREYIVCENMTSADQARNLIDSVRRKGDLASRKLISNFKLIDPPLYEDLRLSCGLSAPPAAEPRRAMDLLSLLLLSPMMSPSFVSAAERRNNMHIYPVTKKSIENRVALLITNIKFTDRRLNRDGAERDEANMKNQLRRLGYEVVTRRDLTGEAIGAAIREFSGHPKLKETDSVVVVIMSHGKRGAVLGVDWKKGTSGDEKPDEFPIDDIYKHLGPVQCKALLNKPKIIIIQACRGAAAGSVPVKDGANAAEPCENVDQLDLSSSAGEQNGSSERRVHREKDFISLLSCTPDAVSYRKSAEGSYLIQFMVDVFKTCAQKDHIVDLFTKVLQRFEDFPIASDLQMPTIDRCSLTKHFYFKRSL